jgi:hypothetical protein
MADQEQILENADSVLLVDWPGPGIPRALVQSGVNVFCFSPDGYTQAGIVAVPPKELDPRHVFPPANDEEMGFLIFWPLNHPPAFVDIVTIYRSPEEHAGIIKDHVIPLGARVIWLQPSIKSSVTQELAFQHGLVFIQGKDIREMANRRMKKKNQE